MSLAFEERLDSIENQLKEKISIQAAFADKEVQARQLKKTFQFFDINDSGTIDFDEFVSAMTQLNFIGIQRELEALFDRYDDDCSGSLAYGEFAYHVFGLGERSRVDNKARSVIERVKGKLQALAGSSGIHRIRHFVKSVDRDGSGTLDYSEFRHALDVLQLTDLDDRDVDILMQYFDQDGSGRISLDELLHGLKGSMSRNRKFIVRDAFERLDVNGNECVSVEDLLDAYNLEAHPEVQSGRMTEEEAVREFLDHLESAGGDEEDERDGVVTWTEFLEYYKQVSAMIEDDHEFIGIVRNGWFSDSQHQKKRHHGEKEEDEEDSQSRRRNSNSISLIVVHSNGEDEIVSLPLSLGLDVQDKEEMKERLRESGVHDVADVLPHFQS